MIYSDLILNERNWGNLRSAIKNHRLHHALLFHGPSGVGKSAHAVELAAILNCLQPTTEGACGLCSSCIKVRTFQHENVKLILPFPRKTGLDKNSPSIKALSDVDLASLNEQMLEMGKNPYFKIVLENANTILINSIRDLKNELYLSVPGGGSRIVLIMDAELLCLPDPASANALLKILEEPPEKTYFILISSRADLLLETILSRCQKVFFPALSEKDIESYLTEEGESRSNAHLIANVSEGNMHLAQSFKGSVPQLYENAKTILNAVFTKQPDRWKKFHKEVNRMKKNSRVELEYFFRTGIFAFRDLMILAETKDSDQVVFSDNLQKYHVVLDKFPKSNWAECIQLMEDALSFIRANGSLPIVINAMLMDMGKVIKGTQINRFSLQR